VYSQLLLPGVLSFVTGIFPFSLSLTLFPTLTNVMRLDFNGLSDAHVSCLLVNSLDVVGAGILGALGVYIAFQLFTLLNFTTILTNLTTIGFDIIQLLANSLIVIRTSNVAPHIQIALMSILVALLALLWAIFF
jgi:hypothetical protein